VGGGPGVNMPVYAAPNPPSPAASDHERGALLDSSERELPPPSMDEQIEAAGAFGRAQLITSAYAFAAWTVHGMQVMSMAFTAPAAAAEFDADRGSGGGGGGGSAGDAAAMKLTASFFFAGWMLGLSIWGGLAARRGWLVALGAIQLCVVAFGCATAACGGPHSFLLFRFLCGFAEGGVPTTSFGWAGEFMLPRSKVRVGFALLIGFHVGSLAITVGAFYLPHSWRLLSAGTSLLALPLSLCALFLLPESPRYLQRSGRAAQAAGVLRRMALQNGRLPPPTLSDAGGDAGGENEDGAADSGGDGDGGGGGGESKGGGVGGGGEQQDGHPLPLTPRRLASFARGKSFATGCTTPFGHFPDTFQTLPSLFLDTSQTLPNTSWPRFVEISRDEPRLAGSWSFVGA